LFKDSLSNDKLSDAESYNDNPSKDSLSNDNLAKDNSHRGHTLKGNKPADISSKDSTNSSLPEVFIDCQIVQ